MLRGLSSFTFRLIDYMLKTCHEHKLGFDASSENLLDHPKLKKKRENYHLMVILRRIILLSMEMLRGIVRLLEEKVVQMLMMRMVKTLLRLVKMSQLVSLQVMSALEESRKRKSQLACCVGGNTCPSAEGWSMRLVIFKDVVVEEVTPSFNLVP
ncbi:unnamed protein product, partial [Vitis vinifera]